MSSAAVAVVDGHVHVGRWATEAFGGRATTLSDAVRLYRELGFAGALVTTTDRADNEELLAALRDHEGSPALRFAWWVEPGAPRAFERLTGRLPEVAALKIHPSFLRRPVNDPAFAPFLRLAGASGRPVMVHCGRWQEVAGYALALDAAERHPDTRFILGHMGGDEPLLVRGAVAAIRERGLGNVWLGTESLRQYWVVQEAADALGAARLVFGSDYNLNHPAAFRAVVDALALSAADRARILGGTLNELVPPELRFFGA